MDLTFVFTTSNRKMVMRSVLLLLVVVLHASYCRRLAELDNEISVGSGTTGMQEPEIWIKISTAPQPVINKPVGSYVELECEAMGSPPPSIQWLKGKTPLSERRVYENNFISENPSQGLSKIRTRLVINYLMPFHRGQFTCRAESGSQEVTAYSTIHVISKEGLEDGNFTELLRKEVWGVHHVPRISLWIPTYMDLIGTNILLPCTSFGNPKPSIVWKDPLGQIINEEGRVSVLPDGELSIRSLSWSDMGIYTCIARNRVGRDFAETFIYPMKESK